MVRIRFKGKPYTNVMGEFRRIYKNKDGKEYIIWKNKRKNVG